MLNTVIYPHNGVPSALSVIIRPFHTLTALDMKRSCQTPGCGFHYLTSFSFTMCLVIFGILHLPNSRQCFFLPAPGQAEGTEKNSKLVPTVGTLTSRQGYMTFLDIIAR